jgi:hypothetical protein
MYSIVGNTSVVNITIVVIRLDRSQTYTHFSAKILVYSVYIYIIT